MSTHLSWKLRFTGKYSKHFLQIPEVSRPPFSPSSQCRYSVLLSARWRFVFLDMHVAACTLLLGPEKFVVSTSPATTPMAEHTTGGTEEILPAY